MKISNCKYNQSVNSNKLAKLRKKKYIQVLFYSSYTIYA